MLVVFLIAIGSVLIDQITKLVLNGFFIDVASPIIEGTLSQGESITVIDKVLSFTYVLNKGAAFGILQNQRIFFLIATVLVCVAGIIALNYFKKRHWTLVLSSGLILGGAIGNMIDRVVIGCVRDFIDATVVETITGYAFPVFNFADICVCVGVAILSVYILFIHDKIYVVKKDAKDNS